MSPLVLVVYTRQLRYVSITVSFFHGLNGHLGLNVSYGSGYSLFLKWHITWCFLPHSSNFVFNLAVSILLAVGTNLRPLDKRETSASERVFLER